VDNPTFRANFPEFANTTVYPDSMLTFWATLAEAMLPVRVWNTIWPLAVNLYVAHELVLAAQNVSTSSVGGSPGQSGGIANSKTVGSASIGYDSVTPSEKDAGFWNLTNYGRQLYRLMMIFGAGCIQL
jgi:Protein of unknown function (DUF4054)